MSTQLLLPVTALAANDPDDGDAGRRQRGLAIAAVSIIKRNRVGFKVRSQSGRDDYTVRLDGENGPACDCPDFDSRGEACKHIYAVQCYIMREEHPESSPEWTPREKKALEAETVVKKPTYQRDWSKYNEAQVQEKPMFVKLLRDLADTMLEPPQETGRPRFSLADRVFSTMARVYSTKSTRRSMGYLEDAVKDGLLAKAPDFSSITRWMESPELTPLLIELLERSALPFAELEDLEETVFAADSSGFSVVPYERWYDTKWGRPATRHQYAKAHITVGVQSKIVTAAVVTPGPSADAPQLPAMVQTTARNFTIDELSGDLGYVSRYNLQAVVDAGGMPYIPYKVNSVARNPRHKQDAKMDLWERLFHYWQLHREDWLEHYHQRSNVEAAFWMSKSKFGSWVRNKSPIAQVNEIYAKLLCHNLVVVAKAMIDFGIEPEFGEVRELLPMAA